MTTIQQIAIPVDFHQHTDELAAFALGIAGKLGARPTFIHVVENIATVASYSDLYPDRTSLSGLYCPCIAVSISQCH